MAKKVSNLVHVPPEGQVFHWYTNPPGLIKRILRWIRRLIIRLIIWAKAPANPYYRISPDSPDLPPWRRHDKPEPRYVELRSVGANSPRRQPCDGCGSWVRREKKTRTANSVKFYCPKCNMVMVLSLRQKREEPWQRYNRGRRRWHLGRRRQAA